MTKSANLPAARGLGYSGLSDFQAVTQASAQRKALLAKLSQILPAHQFFCLFEEKDIRQWKRQAGKQKSFHGRGRQRLRAAFKPLREMAEEISLQHEDFPSKFLGICIAVTLLALAAAGIGLMFSKAVLLALAGTEADLPGRVAATAGALSIPATALSFWILWFWWNLTPWANTSELCWYKIPIADYKPPMPEPLVRRLENLYASLQKEDIPAEFFVLHGTTRDKDSVTKLATTLTKQAGQLQQWQEEPAFITMKITFEDGESQELFLEDVWK